jgi:hypothetical protein
MYAQNTPGTLTFTFTTPKHTTGNYNTSGNFVLAAWIETTSGTFVKTKMRYVGTSTADHLPAWAGKAGCPSSTQAASTACNRVDATTGATLTTFTAKTFTWDGKNTNGTANGSVVADGNYRVALQETWGHGTATTTRYFNFVKGIAVDSQTPASDATFTNISLVWTPDLLAVDETPQKKSVEIYPNPATTSFTVVGENIRNLNIFDTGGKLVKSLPSSNSYDVSELPAGVYFIEINTDKDKIVQKLIKK